MDNRKPSKSRGTPDRPSDTGNARDDKRRSRTQQWIKTKVVTETTVVKGQDDGKVPANKGVSVMDAVSKLNYAPSQSISTVPHNPPEPKYTSQSHSPDTLMTALGAQDQPAPIVPRMRSSTRTSRVERPSRAEKTRERSSSRSGPKTTEEKKQSIREARARSRSRSNTRASMRPATGSHGVGSVAPSTTSLSRTSSVTEKTKTSQRPKSGTSDGEKKRKSTQQLILLRHAARCPYGADSRDTSTRGPCPIHKNCAEMKALLSHMKSCTDDESCPFPSCSKSKHLLDVVYPNRSTPTPPTNNLSVDTLSVDAVSESSVENDGLLRSFQRREASGRTIKPASSLKEDQTPPKQQDPLSIMSIASRTSENTPRVTNAPQVAKPKEIRKPDATPYPPEELLTEPVMIDIEMGSGNDDALEQQSLLEEIHARRMKRAPKATTKKPPRALSISTVASSNSSLTGSITHEIRRRAEELMIRMKRGEEDGIFFGTGRSPTWLRIGKFFCIFCGFTVILSFVSLVLLYIFGGEEWTIFEGKFFTETTTEAPAPEVVFIPVEGQPKTPTASASPVPVPVPMEVQEDGPTMSPTSFSMVLPYYTTQAIEEHNAISGEDKPPQAKAYDWVRLEQEYLSNKFDAVSGETVMFDVDQWRNRFALATLYYSTTASKSKPQRSGNPISKSANWTHSNNWLYFGVSECEWSFYSCDGGDSLWITNNGLKGTLPPEMGMLTRVRDMAIMNNPTLEGSLPSQLGLLQHTSSMNLQENKLSGSIPSEIGNMRKLRWLYLNGNKLEDKIPVDLGHSSRLAFLWLNDNKLSGPLDPKLFVKNAFKHLKELLLHNNELTGPIPNEVGMMPRVRFISMHENKITGTIPTTFGLLTNLEVLKLHDTLLTGSVPEEVCHLVKRGSLTELTIDCDKVACDCGCSCTGLKGDRPPPPVTTTAATVETKAPTVTARPTKAPPTGGRETAEPSASATTGEPSLAASVELKWPSAAPSAVIVTRRPTEVPTPMPVASPVSTPPPSPLPSASPTKSPTPSPTRSPTPVPTRSPTQSPTQAAPKVENEQPPTYGGYDVVSVAADFMLQLPDFTKEALLNVESPQSLALDWLQGDPKLNEYSFERKLQRYAMATIFISTNGTEWTDNDNWLDHSVHECDWFTTYTNGAVCTSDPESGERFIKDLVQWGNNLYGPLPPEISLLKTLEKVFLGVNNITSIPTELGLLSNSLRVLNMMHCSLEGPLPSQLGELKELKKMDVSENYFEGTIPTELGRLKLENLYLNHNMFYGEVPPELFDLSTAKAFNIAANSLSGTLPTEIGKLEHVQWMNLYGNWLEGTIPSEIGMMKRMISMHISYNLLRGSIPSEMGKLSSSHSLSVDIGYNELSGTIPSELGDLTNLVVLALEGNSHLSGAMPAEICDLAFDWKLDSLSLDCSAVSCGHQDCGLEQEGGLCICRSDDDYDDDDDDGR